MAGIQYRKLAIDVGAALRKAAFKPNTHFTADPVPAANPQMIPQDYKFRPGHTAPDPVPARSASETYDIPSFTAIDADDFIGPDPVPSVNFWEE